MQIEHRKRIENSEDIEGDEISSGVGTEEDVKGTVLSTKIWSASQNEWKS